MGGRTIQQLVITINCGNAAFGDEPEAEVARILRAIADEIIDGVICDRPVMDVNGNKVGELKVSENAEFVDRPVMVMDVNGNKVGELRVVENAEPDGWVFVNNETKVEIGFAEPQEYSDASDAVDRFGREYMVGDFGVYFRRNRELFGCSDESRPEDFD